MEELLQKEIDKQGIFFQFHEKIIKLFFASYLFTFHPLIVHVYIYVICLQASIVTNRGTQKSV